MAYSSIPSSTNPRNDLTAEYVRAILDYETETGLFRWKTRSFDDGRITKIWNTKHAGKIAGTVCVQGYVAIGVDDHPRKAHRLAWLWVTGEWPVEVDHKDRNRANNRWSNLRHADDSTNQHNRGISKK